MKKIKHPHGNIRSFFLKFIKNLIQRILKFLVNCVCKLDSYDEIIISSATHAPWKKDKKFYFRNYLGFVIFIGLIILSYSFSFISPAFITSCFKVVPFLYAVLYEYATPQPS